MIECCVDLPMSPLLNSCLDPPPKDFVHLQKFMCTVVINFFMAATERLEKRLLFLNLTEILMMNQ